VAVLRDGIDPDEVALSAIDAGADDIDTDGDPIEIMTAPGALEAVRRSLESAGVAIESAELTMHPKAAIDVDVNVAHQNLRLIESLEDLDDVQRVTANFNLPAEVLAEAAAS